MSVRGAWVLFVLALVAIITLWWFTRTTEPPPSRSSFATAGEPGSAAQAAPLVDAAPAPQRTSTAPGETSTTPLPTATIRGRCVDAAGHGLANARVRVTGSIDSDQRRDAWNLDHEAAPPWNDVLAQSGDDGRFVATFWPPPPFAFVLEITNAPRVAIRVNWPTIAAGAVIDLGDVVMNAGVDVGGRVVDEAGAPIAGVDVRIDRELTEATFPLPGRVVPILGSHGRSDRDGRFRCPEPLAPGNYDVHLAPRYSLAKPVRVVLDPASSVEDVVVVLRAPRPEATIAGRAIDTNGEPVANVRIDGTTESVRVSTTTAADGTFSLGSGDADTTRDAALRVQHPTLEPIAALEPIHWGTPNVVVRLRASAQLALRVFDERQQALHDYAVRIASPDQERTPARGTAIRARGPFADGVATFAIERGRWIVAVEFAASERRAAVFTPVVVADAGTTQLDVIAPRDVERSVRVVGSGGAPIAGAVVQLCAPVVPPLTERSRIVRRDGGWFAGPWAALLLAEGTTDAAGRVKLAGPPGRELALGLPGPGHVPQRVAAVPWNDTELVVNVVTGARLHGRLGPPAALTEILGGAGSAKEAPRGARLSLVPPEGEGSRRRLPAFDQPPLAIADDGTFDFSGLPPGEWNVEIGFHVRIATGMYRGERLVVGSVVLRDAESTHYDPDATSLVPGTITGTLQMNGLPAGDAKLVLLGTDIAGGDRSMVPVQTGSDGAFTQNVRAGDWRITLQRRNADGSDTSWPLGTQVTVVAGQTVTQFLELRTGMLAITVVDANGNPMDDVDVRATGDAPDARAPLPRTDARGVTSTEATATTFRLRTLPRRLQPQAARNALWAEAQKTQQTWEAAFAKHWIDLGSVTVAAGQTTTVTLHLPPEFEK